MEQEKEGRSGAVVLLGRPASIGVWSKSVRQKGVKSASLGTTGTLRDLLDVGLDEKRHGSQRALRLTERKMGFFTPSSRRGEEPPGRSQNKSAQVRILGKVSDPAAYIIAIDFHNIARFVGGAEQDVVKDTLHHSLQPSRPDILDGRIDQNRHVRNGVDGVIGEFQGDALGLDQCHVLLDQRGLGLSEDALQVVARPGLQLDPDRYPAVQFRQQVGWLGKMEGSRRDE